MATSVVSVPSTKGSTASVIVESRESSDVIAMLLQVEAVLSIGRSLLPLSNASRKPLSSISINMFQLHVKAVK